MTVKLTRAGRQLLRHAATMPLTLKAGFTPTGQQTVTATETFVLRR